MIHLIKLVCTVGLLKWFSCFISLNLLSRVTTTYDHFHEPEKIFLCLSITYNQAQSCKSLASSMYLYVEPVCPLFWWLNPSKQGLNSNQNKGHLGSRYIYIYVYCFFSGGQDLEKTLTNQR